MNFIQAVQTCLSKYFIFRGRAGRPEFWWFALFYAVVSLLLWFADRSLFGIDPVTGETRSLLSGVFGLLMFFPLLAASWRRLHDSNRPGWYALLPMLISLCFMVVLFAGVFIFTQLEMHSATPDALRNPAATLGAGGVILAGVVQFVVTVLMIHWLTRASDPRINAYGPPPLRPNDPILCPGRM